MRNAINWFEIPAADFDRAVEFYRTVLGRDIRKGDFMGVPHGFFPADEHGVGGAIIARADTTPGVDGTLIYLDAAPSLGDAVARVERAGGQVLMPATSIGEQGAIAIVRDSEGNRVGLHVA